MPECKKNYRNQPSCVECVHVFMLEEYDTGPEYFCHSDGSVRPPCCSVRMGEWDSTESDDAEPSQYDKWREWSEHRQVTERGICDFYQKDARYDGPHSPLP